MTSILVEENAYILSFIIVVLKIISFKIVILYLAWKSKSKGSLTVVHAVSSINSAQKECWSIFVILCQYNCNKALKYTGQSKRGIGVHLLIWWKILCHLKAGLLSLILYCKNCYVAACPSALAASHLREECLVFNTCIISHVIYLLDPIKEHNAGVHIYTLNYDKSGNTELDRELGRKAMLDITKLKELSVMLRPNYASLYGTILLYRWCNTLDNVLLSERYATLR